MASYRKRGATWRAEVVRGGVRQSATFQTKAAAVAWATALEAELIAARRGEIPRRTVGQALARYAAEVTPGKRGARWEALRLAALQREAWAAVWLADLHAPTLAAWRDQRLRAVTPGSVQREVNLLRAVMTRARREWRWLEHDPFDGFRNPGDNAARTRRVSWREVRAICRALGWPDRDTRSGEVARVWLIALRTGMRAGEVLQLTPAAVDLGARVAYLTRTKNGEPRAVPMTRHAARLFIGWQGWTVTAATLDALFRRARDRCGIKDLHFHDSRREALTRLSRKVNALTLAKISGHRDLSLLLRVYYGATAEEIARRL